MSFEVREITPPGRGAVSVVSLRGDGAVAAVAALVRARRLPMREPSVVRLTIDGEDLDEALVTVMSDVDVELCVHGSPALVTRLLDHFAASTRRVEPRALEERARAWLARAPCESAARILLDQSEGALTRRLDQLRALSPIARRCAIDELLERSRIARFALEPVRVVLSGPVNAGKSTLFNTLLGARRALVSDRPGTTRDVLCQLALFGAYPVWLCDTAGERAIDRDAGGAGAVESVGQTRARAAREAADLVVWLQPASAAETSSAAEHETRIPSVRLATFADRLSAADRARRAAISARDDPVGACARVAAEFRAVFDLPEQPWVPGSAVAVDGALVASLTRLRAIEDASEFARALAHELGEGGCQTRFGSLP